MRMPYAFRVTRPTVVISGAGIAGPALAYWLAEYGYHPVVVEIAAGIRSGGQTVDLRGAGRGVVQRMGLVDQMQARCVRQRGAAWVKPDGSRRAEMPVAAFDGNGLVSKLEILRGDVADVLYGATVGRAEYRFGTRITDVVQHGGGAEVALADGTEVRADLLVGADGPHSAVRRLVFGPEERFVKPLGGYHAWFTAPDHVGLDGWFLLYNAAGGLVASMRPDHSPETSKAGLAFRSAPLVYDRRDLDQQRDMVAARLGGAGWACDELVAAARTASDFYFDAIAQVCMDRWSKDRAVLVGDAGYCPSPLSGLGTSLALVGAYILAGELGPASDWDRDRVNRALVRYEARMRPYVTNAQRLPAGISGYAPMSKFQIVANAAVMTWMQRWPFRSVANRLWMTKADGIELPDYASRSAFDRAGAPVVVPGAPTAR
jgi:2-polyprenyl-6-methoxyphenol hydroxylase-like FAD-dependent oxidoreductase